MNAVVGTESYTTSLQNIIAKALGYPKQGTNVPGGEHAPPDETITELYVAVVQHPGGTPWACPVDKTVDAIPRTPDEMARLTPAEQAELVAALPTQQTLDDSWFPPPVVP